MSKEEFSQFVTALKGMYPESKNWDTEIQSKIWFDLAKDVPAEVAVRFIGEWARSSRFAPTLADFNAYAVEKLVPVLKDANEAWGDVMRAISNYGYSREQEALESLDEITRAVTKAIGFQSICMCEVDNLSVIRGQFRKAYEARAQRKEEERIRNGIREQKLLEGGANERICG